MHTDAVVLDVSGVLVNAADSYRHAIVESVNQHYGTTISHDEVRLFKDAGGFNNDWELTYAAALSVLAAREANLSVTAFTGEVEVRGDGLDTARATVGALLSEPSVVFNGWDLEAPRGTFQTLYLGNDLCHDLEDDDPPLEAPGYIRGEPVLLHPETLDALGDHGLDVVTGRPAAETGIALDRVALNVADDHRFTMDDWEEGKPHPAALVTIVEYLGASSVIFVGDTLDDVKTVLNADATDPGRVYYSMGVLSGGLTGDDDRQKLSEIGAAVIIEDVNKVLNLLD